MVLAAASVSVGIDTYTDNRAPALDVGVAAAVPVVHSPLEAAAAQFNQDQYCLAEAMYHEARSEGAGGEKAVAEVIFQRVRSRLYPNSVCEVVHEGTDRGDLLCQFSYACNGSLDKPLQQEAWDRSYQLAARIMSGAERIGGQTGHAIAYHTVDVYPDWAPNMLRTGQIGNHIFYRFAPLVQVSENSEEVKRRPGVLMPDGSIVPYAQALSEADPTLIPASSLEIKSEIEVDDAVGDGT
jgi:hypothetical protein